MLNHLDFMGLHRMNVLELQFTPMVKIFDHSENHVYFCLGYLSSAQVGPDIDVKETIVLSLDALADLYEGLNDLARAIKPHLKEDV